MQPSNLSPEVQVWLTCPRGDPLGKLSKRPHVPVGGQWCRRVLRVAVAICRLRSSPSLSPIRADAVGSVHLVDLRAGVPRPLDQQACNRSRKRQADAVWVRSSGGPQRWRPEAVGPVVLGIGAEDTIQHLDLRPWGRSWVATIIEMGCESDLLRRIRASRSRNRLTNHQRRRLTSLKCGVITEQTLGLLARLSDCRLSPLCQDLWW